MHRMGSLYLIASLSLAALIMSGRVQAALPDAAQPGKSVYVSLYGVPGAGLSLDAKFWRWFGFGTSFTAGPPALYPGRPHDDDEGGDIVIEAYGTLLLYKSAGPVRPHSGGAALIGGVYMDQDLRRPLAGICCAYRVDEKVVLRINAVYGPSAGVEAGYVINRSIQAVLTVLSGRGTIGLRFGLVEPADFRPDLDRLARAPSSGRR
jgi:hypothetical protein